MSPFEFHVAPTAPPTAHTVPGSGAGEIRNPEGRLCEESDGTAQWGDQNKYRRAPSVPASIRISPEASSRIQTA